MSGFQISNSERRPCLAKLGLRGFPLPLIERPKYEQRINLGKRSVDPPVNVRKGTLYHVPPPPPPDPLPLRTFSYDCVCFVREWRVTLLSSSQLLVGQLKSQPRSQSSLHLPPLLPPFTSHGNHTITLHPLSAIVSGITWSA